MLHFPSDKSSSNARDAVYAINREETLATLNLRLMEADTSQNLDLLNHLKVVAKSAAAIQHRLVMVANANGREQKVNQRLITHQVSVLAGVIASLELMAGSLPDAVNELEASEERRLEEVKGRKLVERAFSAPVADTANVPLMEMTERKSGRRASFKPDASHHQVPTPEQAEEQRLKRLAQTPQEVANSFKDSDYEFSL